MLSIRTKTSPFAVKVLSQSVTLVEPFDSLDIPLSLKAKRNETLEKPFNNWSFITLLVIIRSKYIRAKGGQPMLLGLFIYYVSPVGT